MADRVKSHAMQGSCGTRWRSETSPSNDTVSAVEYRTLNPPPEASPNSNFVYNLRNGGSDSNAFYAETAKFAEKILAQIDEHAGPILDGYCHHLRVYNEEAPRSRGEYVMEFLTLGMALGRYEAAAQATSRWLVTLAQCLILLRRHIPIFKVPADWLRAGLSRHFFHSVNPKHSRV